MARAPRTDRTRPLTVRGLSIRDTARNRATGRTRSRARTNTGNSAGPERQVPGSDFHSTRPGSFVPPRPFLISRHSKRILFGWPARVHNILLHSSTHGGTAINLRGCNQIARAPKKYFAIPSKTNSVTGKQDTDHREIAHRSAFVDERPRRRRFSCLKSRQLRSCVDCHIVMRQQCVLGKLLWSLGHRKRD